MAERLQSLRVPAGWRINWNTLFEVDPTGENVRRGYFGGSSLFLATHEDCHFSIHVEWRPEDDPSGGYCMRIEYGPWQRTEGGRRKHVDLDFRNADVVHEYQTRLRAELVQELDAWLLRCAERVREPS